MSPSTPPHIPNQPLRNEGPLRSVVYVSRPSRQMTVADLETLLRDAREFNMVKGVTGALLHNGKNFMQCFEGPDQGVLEVYRKIKASRQHCDLVEYFNEPTPQRSFGSWSMSSTLQAQSQALSLSRAQWDQARQTAVFPPPHSPGLGMLEVFWGLSKLS